MASGGLWNHIWYIVVTLITAKHAAIKVPAAISAQANAWNTLIIYQELRRPGPQESKGDDGGFEPERVHAGVAEYQSYDEEDEAQSKK
jgi:hypothetical protein